MSDKYAFIAAEYAAATPGAATLTLMLAWLTVSKSVYYEWLDRPISDAGRRREDLALKVETPFESFGGTYGYRRIHAELLRAGDTWVTS